MKNFNFLIYKAESENVAVNAVIKDETIWLTQKSMAELFQTTKQNISLHLKNIFEEKELQETSTVKKILTVQNEGGREISRNQTFYNLDAIISVGYRVNSSRATQFRIWATKVLKEYIKKGFVLDDERLKQGKVAFDKDYFKELLERVRSIRASERRIWQQITDIFAECSIDYDKNAPITKEFYAMVQNKFHYAITGHTAPEIVYERADRNKEHMGLTTWKNAPNGRILKSDVVVAKNYLSEQDIRRLERTVTGYFDYVEDLIENEQTIVDNKSIDEIIQYLNGIKADLQSRADSAAGADAASAIAEIKETEAPAVTPAENAEEAEKSPAVFAELEGLPAELLEGLDNSLLDQYAGFTGETADSLKRKLNAYRSLYNESYDDTRRVLESKFNDAKSPSNRLKIMLEDGSVAADAMDTIKKDGGMYAAIAKRDAALADAFAIIEQLKSQLEGTRGNNTDYQTSLDAPVDNDEKKSKNRCRRG